MRSHLNSKAGTPVPWGCHVWPGTHSIQKPGIRVFSVSTFTTKCPCLGNSAPSSYKSLTLLNSKNFTFLGRHSWSRFSHAFCVHPAHQARPFGVRLASTPCPPTPITPAAWGPSLPPLQGKLVLGRQQRGRQEPRDC